MASANALDVLPVGESFQKPKQKQKPTSSNRCNESSEWTSPKEDQSTAQSPTTSPTAANMGRMKSSPQPLVNDKTKSHKKSSTASQESKKQKSNEHPTTPTTTTGTKNNSSNVSSNQQQQVQIQPSSPSGAGGVSLNETTAARRSSAGGGRNNGSTKTCCFCWCCCYRCTCPSSRNQEEELSKSKDLTSKDSWSNDPEVTPSVEEIRCWGDSFDRLMKSSMGRVVFREFLKCEYSEENILFWLACEDLKKDNTPEVVEEKARLIYEDYISILSPKEVSLDSRVREIVNRNMVEPSPHTFDEAQLQIYTLMHRDSYPRFVNSSYYKKLAQLSTSSRKESSA